MPFGKVTKINQIKAQASQQYPVAQDTMRALGIMTKSGKRRNFSDRQRKRILYTGNHQIPVFNLKCQDEPALLFFKFVIYRTAVKIYVEAKLFANQKMGALINRNKQLVLELSERLAIKYMQQNDNSFEMMIENLMIVANN